MITSRFLASLAPSTAGSTLPPQAHRVPSIASSQSQSMVEAAAILPASYAVSNPQLAPACGTQKVEPEAAFRSHRPPCEKSRPVGAARPRQWSPSTRRLHIEPLHCRHGVPSSASRPPIPEPAPRGAPATAFRPPNVPGFSYAGRANPGGGVCCEPELAGMSVGNERRR